MSVLTKIKRKIISLGAIFSALILSLGILSTPVFADPEPSENQTTTSGQTQAETTTQTTTTTESESTTEESSNTCYDESGSLGWLVCPTTGFLARITDGLYDIIEQSLVLKPLTSDSDSPYHQIWSIFRDITNVIFVIFFLAIIYSQITGIGISNYGIKKLLPKIIISAILINLSYIICAALVDVSNIAGSSIKSVFTDVEQSVTATGIVATAVEGTVIDLNSIISGLIGGTLLAGLAIGASGGLGALFISLLPVLLGAVIAVAVAYLTIALRQALVYLLIMISPLAFVCNLLPNTEKWFSTWKKSLTQMLFFYPMFATLFGACSLVGWVIIAAAEDGFSLVLGIAVKVVPLIASWSLLKMSGTLPGQISASVTKLANRPLGAVRTYASDEAALRRAKYLGEKPRSWQYGRQFGQHLENAKFRRTSDTQKYLEMSKLRGSAYASQIRNANGKVTKRGRKLTALGAQSLEYQRQVLKNTNDAEKGLYHYATSAKEEAALKKIDLANMHAADELYYETARGEKVRFDNTQSRQERINAAFNANSNRVFNASKKPTEIARPVDAKALASYRHISDVLEGDLLGTHLVGANAAADLDSQTKVLDKKFSSYFSAIPATQELYDRLFQLTSTDHIAKDIDPIISGMAALNMRGDTDLVTDVVERMLQSKQIRLGTHASQSLANFCMFTAKDSDVFLRRFGKYINLETARVYNEGQKNPKRKNDVLSLNEYITGTYDEYDDNGNLIPNYGKSKLSLSQLLEGTPLDKIERTYYDNLATRVRNAYIDKNGEKPDQKAIDAFKAKMGDIETAVAPAYISAMLKYASGSEQIVNAAADLTGLKRGKDGAWERRWEDPKDPFYGVDQKFFTDRVKNYLKWQTPSQILALRTDVFYPILEALGLDYADQLLQHAKHPNDPDHPDPITKISSELLGRMDPKDLPLSELPAWYGDGDEEIKKDDPEDVQKAKKERNKDRRELRKKLAKAAFMDILFKNKTLDQVITSRRSGAANSAKASVRDYLGLDNEDFVDDYRDDVNEHRRKHREERKQQKEEEERRNRPVEEEEAPEPNSETGVDSGRAPILDAEERAQLKESLTEAYNANPDGEAFYDDCIGELSRFSLSEIIDQVQDHHSRNSYESNEELLEFILRCIDDDSNF